MRNFVKFSAPADGAYTQGRTRARSRHDSGVGREVSPRRSVLRPAARTRARPERVAAGPLSRRGIPYLYRSPHLALPRRPYRGPTRHAVGSFIPAERRAVAQKSSGNGLTHPGDSGMVAVYSRVLLALPEPSGDAATERSNFSCQTAVIHLGCGTGLRLGLLLRRSELEPRKRRAKDPLKSRPATGILSESAILA